MREKEKKVCILIHHIATVIGWSVGVKTLCTDKPSGGRKALLILFLSSQTWALIKILKCAATGRQCLRQSFDHIHDLSKNSRTEKTATWLLVAVSSWFKIGTPVLLENQRSIFNCG